MVKVRPPRPRSRARGRASNGGAGRAGPLDSQVSEIRHLIDRLRARDEPKSPLIERTRTVSRSAALAPSARSRRALPSSRAPSPSPSPSPPSLAPSVAAGPSLIEARLVPICERLEGVLGKLETRLDAAPEPASGLPPLASDCTLRGRITESLLPDLLQMVTSNRWTGVFVVVDGPLECRLYFDEGQACHAEAPGTSGEGAFFAALALEQGEYHFLEGTPPADKTITSNTQFLILEALRQIDEAKGSG